MQCTAGFFTADSEISVENPNLTYVRPLKPGVGQNIATHASPIDMNFFLVLISSFSVYSHPFFLFLFSPNLLPTF